MNRLWLVATLALLLVGLSLAWIQGRHRHAPAPPTRPPPGAAPAGLAKKDGESLARLYCVTCHLFPDPSLLDKSSWAQGALPEMRPWLGLASPPIERARDGQSVLLTNVYPSSPLVTTSEWEQITAYYTSHAPVALTASNAAASSLEPLSQFKVEVVPYIRERAMVSMVRIAPDSQRFMIGDALTRTLEVLSAAGERDYTAEFVSGAIDVRSRQDGLDVLLPGRLFPSDLQKGGYLRLTPTPDGLDMQMALGELRRPVDFDFGDLNADGLEDLVICQFGHRLGRLSWFEQESEGKYREHILLERPGATTATIRDFDGDSRPDLLVLMAQAWEAVILFRNLGEGRFAERTILAQPPVFGYAGMEVLDWNGDGHMDFLTVNGDNGEYLAPVKPYHGVRLYLNDGHGNFAEQWFQPMPGAYQARVADFDQDGDLDVAAIAYFPDYLSDPSAGFVYWENQGQDKFVGFSFAQSTVGRWISMDAGDIDGDGDVDLALGSLVMGPTSTPIPGAISQQWQGRSPPVLLLRNKRIQ